jgi:hypothetical protein
MSRCDRPRLFPIGRPGKIEKDVQPAKLLGYPIYRRLHGRGGIAQIDRGHHKRILPKASQVSRHPRVIQESQLITMLNGLLGNNSTERAETARDQQDPSSHRALPVAILTPPRPYGEDAAVSRL